MRFIAEHMILARSAGAHYLTHMPDRSRKPRPSDANELAAQVVAEATGQAPEQPEGPSEKNPAAVALGRLGGKKGGPARAKKLTAKRRKEIARKAARVRWEKEKPSTEETS